jgi:hypothetical protein
MELPFVGILPDAFVMHYDFADLQRASYILAGFSWMTQILPIQEYKDCSTSSLVPPAQKSVPAVTRIYVLSASQWRPTCSIVG